MSEKPLQSLFRKCTVQSLLKIHDSKMDGALKRLINLNSNQGDQPPQNKMYSKLPTLGKSM